jgi:hypothetical protein
MKSDLEKALLADGSPLSLLALAHIENQNDFVREVEKKVTKLSAEIDLLEDRGFTKVVVPNIDCILALEAAGMRDAASVLRRMK